MKAGNRGGFGHGQSDSRGPLFIVVGFVAFIMLTGIGAAVLLRKSEAKEKPLAAPVEVQPIRAAEKPAVQMVDVIVPVKDVQQGEALQQSMFAKVSRPANSLSQNIIRDYGDLKGQYARVLMPALEPVTHNSLTRDQPLNAVADKIPVGFRAVTINVNALTGVEGWASPGAQVDIQWVTNASVGRGAAERKVLLLVQNAKVLSAERQVDQNAVVDPQRPIPTTITLMTSAKDALKISLAAQTGQLVLNLRGAVDSGKASTAAGAITSRDISRSRLDDTDENRVQGKLRMRRPDGTYEEMAVVDGQLLTRVN